jgi:hypothetical protein
VVACGEGADERTQAGDCAGHERVVLFELGVDGNEGGEEGRVGRGDGPLDVGEAESGKNNDTGKSALVSTGVGRLGCEGRENGVG